MKRAVRLDTTNNGTEWRAGSDHEGHGEESGLKFSSYLISSNKKWQANSPVTGKTVTSQPGHHGRQHTALLERI